jgi:hypothetical protein
MPQPMSLDSPIHGPSKVVSSASSHLSYPSFETEASTSTALAPSPPSRELLKSRLYVGNLHQTVDECVSLPFLPSQKRDVSRRTHSRYTLIQIFSKFGNLARLDYLFHKSGPLRGKPRGYAFVEYAGEAVSGTYAPSPSSKKKRERGRESRGVRMVVLLNLGLCLSFLRPSPPPLLLLLHLLRRASCC